MYGKIGKEIGEILSMVCKITGIELIRGGVCPSVCCNTAEDERLRSDVEVEGEERPDDIRPPSRVQGQVW